MTNKLETFSLMFFFLVQAGVTGAKPTDTKEPVLTEGNEAPDNKVLRRLLVSMIC